VNYTKDEVIISKRVDGINKNNTNKNLNQVYTRVLDEQDEKNDKN